MQGDKEARGCVLVIGGARQMPGPVILAATAAMRAGAGKLQIATTDSVAPLVATAVPEALVHGLPQGSDGGFGRTALRALLERSSRVDALLLGPGMIENAALPPLVHGLLHALPPEMTVVLDAGALLALSRDRQPRRRRCRIVITPHAGEMATLCGISKAEVIARPREVAIEAARKFRVIALCKGAETFISDGTDTLVNRAGNVGLATSGSGDTLAGILAGLAARGADPLIAAGWAVHLHALAGEALAEKVAPLGYLAREIGPEIPAIMARLSAGAGRASDRRATAASSGRRAARRREP